MHAYSEEELAAIAAALVEEIRAAKLSSTRRGCPRLILQGPLGAGKSTLARAIIEAFGVQRKTEGSPTFAIAHEYLSAESHRIVHADGYRLRSEAELEATGLLETLWDPEAIILFEWLDLFPEVESALRGAALPVIWIRLEFLSERNRRSILIERSGV